jgi:hypothetical protein
MLVGRHWFEGAMDIELENFSEEKLVSIMVEMHDGLAWLAEALNDRGCAKKQFQLLHAQSKVLELLNLSRQEWMRRSDFHASIGKLDAVRFASR